MDGKKWCHFLVHLEGQDLHLPPWVLVTNKLD